MVDRNISISDVKEILYDIGCSLKKMQQFDDIVTDYLLDKEDFKDYVLIEGSKIDEFVNLNWFIDEAIPNIQNMTSKGAKSFFIPKKYIL